MIEKLNVMNANQYFQKYAVDGIGKGADRWMIKRQLVDAFHKEIFGLVSMRLKTDEIKSLNDIPEGDPEATRVVRNVIHDTVMKWKKLCGMFAMYKETANLIDINDLKIYDEREEESDDQGVHGESRDAADNQAPTGEDRGEHDGYSAEPSESAEEPDGYTEGHAPSDEGDEPESGADREEVITSGYIQVTDITESPESRTTSARAENTPDNGTTVQDEQETN